MVEWVDRVGGDEVTDLGEWVFGGSGWGCLGVVRVDGLGVSGLGLWYTLEWLQEVMDSG